MKKFSCKVWAWTAAAFLGAAALAGEVRFSGIEVKAPADPAAKGTAQGMAPGVTVRGEGTAGETCELQWSPVLGAGEAWQPVADVTVGDDGSFSVDAAGKPGFYRMARPGRVARSGSKGGTGAAARAAVLDRTTEIRTATNIVQAFETSFYVEATLGTLVLNGSGRSGQPLAGKPVKFAINGGTWVQNTDENGQVRFGPFVHWPIRTSTGTISFEGGQGLSPCSESVTVTITKETSRITVPSTNIVQAFDTAFCVEATLGTAPLDGNGHPLAGKPVKFAINGSTWTQNTDENGQVRFGPFTDWPIRTSTGTISFEGDQGLSSSSQSVTVAITKAASQFTLSGTNLVLHTTTPKKLVFWLKDSRNAGLTNQTVTMLIKGHTFTLRTDRQGRATWTPPDHFKAGTYETLFSFVGSETHEPTSKTVMLHLVWAVQIDAINKTFNVSSRKKRFTVSFKDYKGQVLAKQRIRVTIRRKTYTQKTNAKGLATFTFKNLKKGTYKTHVFFTGNSRYLGLSRNVTIKVLGSQATQLAVPDETYFSGGERKPYTAYLQTENEVLEKETLTFTIDGKTYRAKTDAKGRATLRLPGLKTGTYKMTVKFAGRGGFKASQKTATVAIRGAKPLPMLTARNKTYSIKTTDRLYTATLKTPDGLALRNGTVTFTINGNYYTRKTDAKGHATISLPQLDEGVYPMVVKYPGSAKYPASIKKVKITISKFLPDLAAGNQTYSIHAANRRYTATLKTRSGQGIPNETVTFTINGQTYSQKTDGKGQAVTKLPKLTEGVHSMVVKFPGSAYYQAVSKKVKITIK